MTGGTGTTTSKGALRPSDFVHLHNHTHHSLLDGLTKIPDLVNHVKELGMEACAITDHGTLSGAIEFYKVAKDAGVKPIIGIETYVAARTIHDRDPAKDKPRLYYILYTSQAESIRQGLVTAQDGAAAPDGTGDQPLLTQAVGAAFVSVLNGKIEQVDLDSAAIDPALFKPVEE